MFISVLYVIDVFCTIIIVLLFQFGAFNSCGYFAVIRIAKMF
jgi:hypothetical protein